MARDAVISEQDVFDACDAIVAEGERPTRRAVHLKLGRIGSMATIQRHVSAWEARQEQDRQPLLDLTEQDRNEILRFGHQMAMTLTERIRFNTENERKALIAAQDKAQQERDEALADFDEMEAELTARIETLQADLNTATAAEEAARINAEQRLQAQAEALGAAKGRLEAATRQIDELSQHLKDVEAADRDKDRQIARLEAQLEAAKPTKKK